MSLAALPPRSCLAWFVAALLLLGSPGCGGGGEPTGDAAYSQKFEMPAGTKSAADTPPVASSRSEERRREIEESRQESAKVKKGAARRR